MSHTSSAHSARLPSLAVWDPKLGKLPDPIRSDPHRPVRERPPAKLGPLVRLAPLWLANIGPVRAPLRTGPDWTGLEPSQPEEECNQRARHRDWRLTATYHVNVMQHNGVMISAPFMQRPCNVVAPKTQTKPKTSAGNSRDRVENRDERLDAKSQSKTDSGYTQTGYTETTCRKELEEKGAQPITRSTSSWRDRSRATSSLASFWVSFPLWALLSRCSH